MPDRDAVCGENLALPHGVTFLITTALFVGWAYWLSNGRAGKPKTIAAIVLGVLGFMAAHDGVVLARREQARSGGGVVTGVIVERAGPAGADGTRRVIGRRWRRYRSLTTDGFTVHDAFARLILTGSTRPWIVEYRYPCGGPAVCRGKDYVPEAAWRRLPVGENVDVRQSTDGSQFVRLENHPQRAEAAIDLGFAGVLLVGAVALSGILERRVDDYLTAPAVVTAVEPVTYVGATRWRIRFAYFDPTGAAQESADEVMTGSWKPGDDCLAVFSPRRPDLASLRPIQTA